MLGKVIQGNVEKQLIEHVTPENLHCEGGPSENQGITQRSSAKDFHLLLPRATIPKMIKLNTGLYPRYHSFPQSHNC